MEPPPADTVFDLDTLDPEERAELLEAIARDDAGDPGTPLDEVMATTRAWLATLRPAA